MADVYARYLCSRHMKRINLNGRIGRLAFGVLFSLAREMQIEVSARRVMEAGIVKYEKFKNMVLWYAEVNNIYFVEEQYDDWYQDYIYRHPFLYAKMNEQEDVMLHDPDAVVAKLFEEERLMKEGKQNFRIGPMEVDDQVPVVADINDEDHVIFRPKSDADRLCFLYGNWLFNYSGFVSGLVIGHTNENHKEKVAAEMLITLENIMRGLPAASNCSFIQEIMDGLRMHEDRIFFFEGIEAANEKAADSIKRFLRKAFEARGSHIPPMDTAAYPFTDAAFDTINQKTKIFYETKMVVPYDARPMVAGRGRYEQIFESTTDSTDSYWLSDLYEHYNSECRLTNRREVNEPATFSRELKKNLPTCVVETTGKKAFVRFVKPKKEVHLPKTGY